MTRDKAFLEIGGLPLWKSQLEVLRELGPSELFLSGPQRGEWNNCGAEIVSDAAWDAGPLAGIVAVLRRCHSPFVLVLAVDVPAMTSDFLRSLLSSCNTGTGVVPVDTGRFEPLAAVYPTASLSLAEDSLQSRDHSLQSFVQRAIADGLVTDRQVFDDERPLFLNLNTPADLAALQLASVP
jgi:molybdopterin-guanine dinucleotide biosynthesis protein A